MSLQQLCRTSDFRDWSADELLARSVAHSLDTSESDATTSACAVETLTPTCALLNTTNF